MTRIAIAALVALVVSGPVDAQDLTPRFTCHFDGFTAPLLFSVTGDGQGLFNNTEVGAFVVDRRETMGYQLVHFMETTATGNITLTTIFMKAGDFRHEAVHSRHMLIDTPFPSQSIGECLQD